MTRALRQPMLTRLNRVATSWSWSSNSYEFGTIESEISFLELCAERYSFFFWVGGISSWISHHHHPRGKINRSSLPMYCMSHREIPTRSLMHVADSEVSIIALLKAELYSYVSPFSRYTSHPIWRLKLEFGGMELIKLWSTVRIFDGTVYFYQIMYIFHDSTPICLLDGKSHSIKPLRQ